MPFKLEGAEDISQSKKPFKLEGAQDATSSGAEPSFIQRVGEDASKRVGQEKEAIKQGVLGQQSLPSTALQTVGAGAGLVGDIGTEALKSATPAFIKEPLAAKVKQAGEYIAGTDIGKKAITKATETKQAWEDFSKKHPEAAKDLSAMGNIFTTLPISKEAGSLASSVGEKAAPSIKKAGENLIKKGEKQAIEKRSKNIIDLISPKETKKVAEANVGKTVEKGLLRKQEVIPDKFTLDIANTVNQVPGVNPNRSYQYNYNQIAAENKNEAKKLSSALKAANVTIPNEKINQAALNIKSSLAKQTFIVGDAKKVSDKMIKEAGSLIKKNGNTAAGLLKSRQEFDTWAKGQMGGDPFSDANKARGASLKLVRESINNLIADSVPDANVKASLTKQFHLYNALDNIRSKAAKEGKNVITRSVAKLENSIPTNNPYIKHAAGLAGLGLAATHPASLAAAVPYMAYKGATSPVIKKTIGKSLSGIGKILGANAP